MSDLRAAAQMVVEAYDSHEPLAVVMSELRAALEQEPCDIAEDGVCEALECCKAPNPALTCLFTTQMEDSILNAFDLPPHKDIAIHAAHYTQPPRREWRGLTEEEAKNMAYKVDANGGSVIEFYRAIEAALKEKNHE
jgi:hypothetical protein